MAPELSVVVPVSRDERLARCLSGLFGQAMDREAYEVVVVDDGPTRESRAVVAGYPVRYVTQDRRGSYAARNRGVQEARGHVVAFTDADCLPPPGWLAAIRAALDDRRSDVAVGPSYALNSDPVGLLVQAVDDQRWTRLAHEREVNYCDTRNLAGAREIFLSEPFDESFSHGGDLEWGVRARHRGYRIAYVPGMALGHDNVATLRLVRERGVRRGRGLAALHRRHGMAARISGARPLTVMGRDVKQPVLDALAHPALRPVGLAGIAAGNVCMVALLAGLLRVPAWRRWALRPFQLLDRLSILEGRMRGA